MSNRRNYRISPYKRAVKWLNRAKKLTDNIGRKETLIAEKRASVTRIKPPLTKDYVRVQTSGSGDYVGDTCAVIADLEAEIRSDTADLKNARVEIGRMIDDLEHGREKDVLYARYLDYMTFAEIAGKLHISERYVYRAHSRAVNKIANRLF